MTTKRQARRTRIAQNRELRLKPGHKRWFRDTKAHMQRELEALFLGRVVSQVSPAEVQAVCDRVSREHWHLFPDPIVRADIQGVLDLEDRASRKLLNAQQRVE